MTIPLRFAVHDLAGRFARTVKKRVRTVTLMLPFGAIEVNLSDQERTAARELLIRLANHRVLTAQECCDGCIKDAMRSLSDVRKILTDEMVRLSDLQDGPLYALLDMTRDGIKQFTTYAEHLERRGRGARLSGVRARHEYFEALNALRRYVGSCIAEMAKISGTRPARVIGYDLRVQWSDVGELS